MLRAARRCPQSWERGGVRGRTGRGAPGGTLLEGVLGLHPPPPPPPSEMMPPAEDEQSTVEGGEGVGGFALLRALKSGSARKVRPGVGGGLGWDLTPLS